MGITYEEQRTTEQKQIDAEVLERVKRGIALLEKEYGPNWVDKIDLNTLELMSAQSCVLGQVFADYADGSEYETGYDYACYNFLDGAGADEAFTTNEEDSRWAIENNTLSCWSHLQEAWMYVLTPLVHKTDADI